MNQGLKRLLKGAGFSGGALLVGIFFGIFLTPYMLATLGERAYGIYVCASLFAGWCGLLDFGLTTTTSRFVTKYYALDDWDGLNEIGSTAIVLFGALSAAVALTALVACGAASFFATGPDAPTLATALFCSGVSFAISKVSDGVCGVLRGALRQELTGGTVFVFRILFGVVNFAILFFGGRVVALVVGNAFLTLLQLGVYVALLRAAVPRFRFSLRSFRRGRVRELFEYGVFAFLAQVGETAVDRSDLLLISAFMSLNDVARYNLVVVTLCSYLTSFIRETSTWQTNWFAKLAASTEATSKNDAASTSEETAKNDAASTAKKTENGDSASLNAGEKRTRCGNDGCVVALSGEFFASRAAIHRASIYWTLFLAGGVLAFGRAFVERWIGAAYLDVFPALALCVVATALYRGSSETNARALQGVARHRVLAVGAILHGAANVVLSVVFIYCGLGLYGVALGTVLPGVAIHFGWLPNATCRLLGERRRTYWARYLKATALGVAALAGPFAVALNYVKPDYYSICAWGVFYGGVGAAALFALGTTEAEKRTLVRRLQKRRDAASMNNAENGAKKDVA
ncbi:MAG: oligosaccharide flippase family protein [Thermoguttaceae bacterium]|nr:oligosaccharide flippase family protein [Thermoguttaceae bacterium]